MSSSSNSVGATSEWCDVAPKAMAPPVSAKFVKAEKNAVAATSPALRLVTAAGAVLLFALLIVRCVSFQALSAAVAQRSDYVPATPLPLAAGGERWELQPAALEGGNRGVRCVDDPLPLCWYLGTNGTLTARQGPDGAVLYVSSLPQRVKLPDLALLSTSAVGMLQVLCLGSSSLLVLLRCGQSSCDQAVVQVQLSQPFGAVEQCQYSSLGSQGDSYSPSGLVAISYGAAYVAAVHHVDWVEGDASPVLSASASAVALAADKDQGTLIFAVTNASLDVLYYNASERSAATVHSISQFCGSIAPSARSPLKIVRLSGPSDVVLLEAATVIVVAGSTAVCTSLLPLTTPSVVDSAVVPSAAFFAVSPSNGSRRSTIPTLWKWDMRVGAVAAVALPFPPLAVSSSPLLTQLSVLQGRVVLRNGQLLYNARASNR